MMNGSSFERLVRHSADRAELLGLKLIQTSPRFVGRVNADGAAAGRLVSLGALDFIGDFRGRYVSFDAKSTRHQTRFDLRLIKRHQALIVKNAHERGACAFFLLELGAGSAEPRYFALPWLVLEPWWRKFSAAQAGYIDQAPASIPLGTLEAEAVPVMRKRQTLDLVSPIEALLARAS